MADSDEEECGEKFFNEGGSFTYFHPLSARKHFRFSDPCNHKCLVRPICKSWCDERYKFRNWQCWKTDAKYYAKKAFKKFIGDPIGFIFEFFLMVVVSVTAAFALMFVMAMAVHILQLLGS